MEKNEMTLFSTQYLQAFRYKIQYSRYALSRFFDTYQWISAILQEPTHLKCGVISVIEKT